MQRRPLPGSGMEVSVLGLGCNNFGGRLDRAQSFAVIDAALDHGVNFFDVADVYGGRGAAETLLGEALQGRRDGVVLATKFGRPMRDGAPSSNGSASYVAEAVEASLKRLRTDRIDLYYLHYEDPATPAEETVRALAKLVRQGKVRALACSNVSTAYLERSLQVARDEGLPAYVTVQDEYSLLYRAVEDGLFPVLERQGLSFIPFYPLASGLLTGKYRLGADTLQGTRLSGASPTGPRFLVRRNLEIVEALLAFGQERGYSLVQLAMGWLLAHSAIPSVIAGASSPAQVAVNAAACSIALAPDDLAALDRIAAPARAAQAAAAPQAPHEQVRAGR